MKKPRSERTAKIVKITDDHDVESFVESWMELIEDQPELATIMKVAADQEGLSVNVWVWKTVADGLFGWGVPLPPKLRKHISELPDVPEALRKKLLTRDLN